MSGVLVDSSAWIDFFRGETAAVRRIDALLADDRVATTPLIAAEVTSGVRTRPEFDRLRDRFAGLETLAEPDGMWAQVAEARFALARRGHQAHLVDLAIAVTARGADGGLLTRDRDFERIAEVVPFDLVLF